MNLFQRLLYTAFAAVSFVYFTVSNSLSHWKQRGILHEKPKFLWGNLVGVGFGKRHINTAIQEIYEKFKGKAPFIGFYAYLKPMVLTLDLDMINHVLVKDTDYFAERGLYCNIKNDPLSCNLMQLEGEEWMNLRERLQSNYSIEKINLLMPNFSIVANVFLRSLKSKIVTSSKMNISELVDSYNLDVISKLVYGIESNSILNPKTQFRQMAKNYMGKFNLVKAYLALNYPMIARILQFNTYNQTSTKYFLKLVFEKICEREQEQERHPQVPQQQDFLNLLIALKKPVHTGSVMRAGLTNTEIAAQTFSFIAAGLDACNVTLAFCLYELALHPDVQERVRNEIANSKFYKDGKFNMDNISKLRFLRQVLYETMRLHTPYPILLRNTVTNYEVPNSVFMLQKNNHVIIPIYAIHHDQRYYPEPERFDPNRFHVDVMCQRHPMSWLTYGLGSRDCIAREFVEMQLLIGLAILLTSFKFSPCKQTKIPMEYDNRKVILTPKSDIMLHMERVILYD